MSSELNMCSACGGILGRECFNTGECQDITASMQNQSDNTHLLTLLQSEEIRERVANAVSRDIHTQATGSNWEFDFDYRNITQAALSTIIEAVKGENHG